MLFCFKLLSKCKWWFYDHSRLSRNFIMRSWYLFLFMSILQSCCWACDRCSREARRALRCAWSNWDPHLDLPRQPPSCTGASRPSKADQGQPWCGCSPSARSFFFVTSASPFLPHAWPCILWTASVAWPGAHTLLLQPDQPPLVPGWRKTQPCSLAPGNRRVAGAGTWSRLQP